MKLFKKVFVVIIGCFAFLILLASCGGSGSNNHNDDIQNKYYNVTFMDSDGTILYETKVKYGEYPKYSGETPTRASDGESNFEFDCWGGGWGYDSPIFKDTIFVAIYKAIPITDSDSYTNVNLDFELCDGGYKIIKFKGFKDNWKNDPNIEKRCLVLPTEYNGASVVAIGEDVFNPNAYMNNSNSKVIKKFGTVQFPSRLREIGNNAFRNSNITKIELPSSTRIIGERAFMSCTALNSIKLNNGLIEIGEYAFCGAGDSPQYDGMRTLRIPLSVTKVGAGIFNYADFRDVCFYCEAPSKPSGWSIDWHLKDGIGHPYVNKSSYYTNIYWGA